MSTAQTTTTVTITETVTYTIDVDHPVGADPDEIGTVAIAEFLNAEDVNTYFDGCSDREVYVNDEYASTDPDGGDEMPEWAAQR